MKKNVTQKGLEDQNRMFSGKKRLNDGVVNGGQGSRSSIKYDEVCNKVTEDANSRVGGLVQIHESLQMPKPQPQGEVHWERFLPLRSIKVLLVEDDDSTCHVVSALLRNCSYEVTAVPNGLQAWKVLEDPGNHIDLILTEVAMPILSGIGLLGKIMSHKTLKNIPVIMMSSHDSMGIVFKCLSKGAVDFLVKPIRRNELKNLWQHVWRRCHSSSGSGSESGTHTRKSAKSRTNDASGNNSDSSNEHGFGSKGLCNQDGSDNGSGTQSSWTKCPPEVGSPHPASPHLQLVDGSNSTDAQVTKPVNVSNRWVHATEKECLEQSDQLDDVAMGKDMDIRISLNMQLENLPEELSTNPTCKTINKMSDVEGGKLNKGHSNYCDTGLLLYNDDKTRNQENQALNVVNAITDSSSPKAGSRDINPPNSFSEQHPSLELTLKRLGGVRYTKNVPGDECNVLRHSDLSAFSKYNTTSTNQAQTGNVERSSPKDKSSISLLTRAAHNFPSQSNGALPNQGSNGSNNINDMASTDAYYSNKAFNQKDESGSGVGSSNPSALQAVQNMNIYVSSSHQQIISVQAENAEILKARVGGCEQGFQVKHNRCNPHHYNQISPNAMQELRADYDDAILKKITKAGQQCVTSDIFGGQAESNAAVGNIIVDGSADESGHGSNGLNEYATNLKPRISFAESVNGAAENVADEGRVSLREAALTKFRQKRKERCFEKRVRYHSRKKLAEQRPRIRGQFVRRNVSDAKEEKDTSGHQ